MKKSKPPTVVISGYYGFDNFGDESILSVLINKLKELDAKIAVITKTPKKTSELHNVKTAWYICPRQIILSLLKCDVLVSGGGSLLQDVTSLKSLLYYLWVINTALFFKKKVIIFAQGIGPINSKLGQFLTKKALKKCSLITVRDEKSLFLLRGWGIDNVELVCDPLFDIEIPPSFRSDKVGVQLRDFKNLKEELLIKLAQQINENFSLKEIEIFSFQDSIDLSVCKRFEAILKVMNPQIKTQIIYNQSSKELIDKISKLEYFIAMRFHANLIALKSGVKTLAVSYDEKVEKLAKEAQIPCITINSTEDFKTLFEEIKNLNANKLKEFANSKHFDWSKIEDILKV
ncbi:MAG TPA: polysaccharide pyruvyl transferase CsaB [Candidatus Gastranaerophilaceae bacterium]|nr:polysaccharide pyruvyl transferase CsaB [Candidatus Gastranaerophilaceae bacterium]HPT42042.1 polysaccharide pyruvyl transferase CsaB [Candidatus Gastranaerophilaceae bacterium]